MNIDASEKISIYIRNRVTRYSKNFMAITTGSTGSGKSYHNLALAEKIDPDFNIDRIAFTSIQLMDIINRGKLKKGSVILVDEFGTAHFSRNFAKTGNIMINFLLQTFRKFGYIFLATTPSLSYIDKASRILFHGHFVMKSIDPKKKTSTSIPFLLQSSQFEYKIYTKFLRVRNPETNDYVALNEMTLPIPSKKLRDAYEQKKGEFLNALNKQIEFAVKKSDSELGPKKLEGTQLKIFEMHKAGKPVSEIAKALDMGKRNVYNLLSAIARKGHEVNILKYQKSAKNRG